MFTLMKPRAISAIQVIIGGHIFAAGIATYYGNETWYNKFLMPCFRWMFDAETGHQLAVKMAQYGLMPRVKTVTHSELVSLKVVFCFTCLSASFC